MWHHVTWIGVMATSNEYIKLCYSNGQRSMIQIKSYDLNDYNRGHKCNLRLKTKYN